MSTSRASKADQPPQKDDHQLPLSLLSLPEDIVLNCLARVPRNCYLNLSMVSKTLRSLVRSSELNRLRSLLDKKSLYIYYDNAIDETTNHWFTLSSIEKTGRTVEYQLVPVSFPFLFHHLVFGYSTVMVGSEIYFVCRSFKSPSDLWILDTRSGKFTQGPSMKVMLGFETVGVIDGKIYVIGVVGFPELNEVKFQVEVFDIKSQIWKSAGQEKVPPRPWGQEFSASLEGKVYFGECGGTSVYNPREGEGKRMVHMVRERLVEHSNPQKGIRKKCLSEPVCKVCVVENVLYACYDKLGLMWFDTKLNVWRKLVCGQKEICGDRAASGLLEMAEYEGKLAIFKIPLTPQKTDTCNVEMFLIALHRVGEKIFGKVEWSGNVATIPCGSSDFLHSFVVSN